MTPAEMREHYEAEVKGPGKFEGESPWVPYFWDRLDEADQDENGVAGWTVSAEDKEVFPELRVGDEVWLQEDSLGFVCEVDPPTYDDETCDYCGHALDTDGVETWCPYCDHGAPLGECPDCGEDLTRGTTSGLIHCPYCQPDPGSNDQ